MSTKSVLNEGMGSSTMGSHMKDAVHNDRESAFPTAEECLAQVDRLVGSPLFLGSEALCKLLRYLAHHTIYTPTDHLKEYEIAMEAFGRPTDFDPQTDSYVRVQMGRLRSKLTSYYETEGASDSVLIDVPKGRYMLLFERRGAVPEAKLPGETDAVQPLNNERSSFLSGWRGRRLALIAAAVVLAVGVGAVGLVMIRGLHTSANALSGRTAAKHVDRLAMLWAPFIQGTNEPIVVFANANFVGDAETGMRYYNPSRDPHNDITQRYTGVGEVMGVLKLARFFQRYGQQFHVKRGSLFTLDDAHGNNLIFVGSPTENLTLGQIPGTQEFVFRHVAAGPGRWKQIIINTHPQAGESAIFVPADAGGQDGDEYAVVALRRGLDPERWVLILAGTSTIETQAAVDYVCDAGPVENLLKRLNVSKSTDLKPFEALLRVKVADDVPLAVQLVALRQTER